MTETAMPEYYPYLQETLMAFREGLLEALPGNLVAIYVTGSLLMGDFEPASSDLDFLVVTHAPLSLAEVEGISAVHARLAGMSTWGDRLEGGYAAQPSLRSWGIEGPIAAVEPGTGVRAEVQSDYSADNMLAIRDYSLTLYGPVPHLVLPPVDRITFMAALRQYLAELVTGPGASEPSLTEVASWVLNIARCLYGLEQGRPCTKREAATWLASRAPTLEPALSTALTMRRGAIVSDADAIVRGGFVLLQQMVDRQAPDAGTYIASLTQD